MFNDPVLFLVTALFLVPAAVIALPAHEMAHVLAADLQGDRSPRNRGFLRPDPRLFAEPYGLLAIFLAKVGWTRPAPINEHRLRGTGGRVIYALAGPAGNLVVAVVAGVAFRILTQAEGLAFDFRTLVQPPAALGLYVLYAIFFLNLSMCVFNLLPIPGLDGWAVLEALFRRRWPRFFFDASVRRREIWMVCALVVFVGSFFAVNVLNVVMLPLYAPLSKLILGICAGYPGLAPCPL